MTDPLMTERLILRRFVPSDVAAVTAALQRFEISVMLPRVPWPYTVADAEAFIAEKAAHEPLTFAITKGDALIGAVSAHDQLGYWLLPEVWGQGYAIEASRVVLCNHFATSDRDVPSGHRLGNARSRSVLTRLGFVDTATRSVFCNAEVKDVTIQDMTLTRAAWEAIK